MGIYIKILPSFSVYRKHFFYFLYSIYKIVSIMDIYKSLNISTGTVMKNPEMLKLVRDHFKMKEISKRAVKTLSYLLRYVPDQFKTQ